MSFIQSIVDWLVIIAFLIWIITKSKPYKEGLDEFNKTQEKPLEKIKPKTESEEFNLIQEDVIAGLHTLGYSRKYADKLVKSIPCNGLTAEELLREALNQLQPARTVINIRDSVVQRTNFNTVDDTKKVNYKPQVDFEANPLDVPAPLRRLTQWYPVVTEAKEKIKSVIQPTNKPDKLLKPKVKRACLFELLTKEDMSDLKNLLSENIFKQFSYISLAWLKTKAIRQGIDDWISLIDSRLSYEENIMNIQQQYGISLTDKEMLTQYNKYEGIGNDFYQNIGENYDFNLSR